MNSNIPIPIASNGDIKTNLNNRRLSSELFDGVPVAIYTCDHLGRIISYNHAAVQLWGRTPELDKDLWCGSWKIFWPDGSLMTPDAYPMARALKEGIEIKGEEIIIEHPDGSVKNILPSPVPLFDEAGVLIGAINTLIDITEQKQGEKKQAMLAAIIQSSEDAIISKTLDSKVTSWNQAAEKLFGYTEEEMIGQHIALLIPPDRLQEEDLIIQKLHNNETVEHFETFRLSKDGRQIPISLTISPIRDNKNQVIGASKIARDISRQKESEAQLQKLFEDLKVINAQKDEFIGLASHELKTPVTSISAYLQLIGRTFLPEDPNKMLLSKAQHQVSRLTALVSDLLDVTKMQNGKLPLSFSDFDLVAMTGEVLEILQQTNPGHQIKLYCDDREVWIEADQQRIEQVIINLVSNAVKYAPGTDEVIIRVSSQGTNVKVSVQDFGPGIDLQDQEKIFTRFYRVEKGSGSVSGLGIGLYISHEIIFRHHGKLHVKSTPGEGSTFVFELPVAATTAFNS